MTQATLDPPRTVADQLANTQRVDPGVDLLDEPEPWHNFDDERPITERCGAWRVAHLEIEFVHSDQFTRHEAAEEILAPMPAEKTSHHSADAPKPPPGTPPYLAALYFIPLLTPEQEYHLFRKMNYLKYRASRLQSQLDPHRPQAMHLGRIERLLADALRVRNHIVQANLRLVVSIAKKLVDPANSFDDLVSTGNLPLIRAAEIFDFQRGTRFSTYATWAIRNRLYREVRRGRRHEKRYLNGTTGVLDYVPDGRSPQRAQESYHRQLKAELHEVLERLDTRDRSIVVARFGLDGNDGGRRFREIAEANQVSAERIRQLLARALRRLRQQVDETELESA